MFLRDDLFLIYVCCPRSVQRPDGKIVTIYSFHDQPKADRIVAATISSPRPLP
jgi:hypothetical protein